MPKWKSPLFSDIRNAIGDNVVFSQWKGRPFFRSYVIPANPNTFKQKANRVNNTDIIKRFQGLMADPDVKAAWNVTALPYLISGYNVFTKWGRLSKISAAPASGATPLAVVVTYTCGIPLARAALYCLKGTTWTDITPVAGFEAGPDKTFNITLTGAGTYYLFLADKNTVVPGDTGPMAYQAITKWKPNYTTGLDNECKVVVSV